MTRGRLARRGVRPHFAPFLLLTTFGALGLLIPTAESAAADPCAPMVNPIACENSKPGNPSSEWNVPGAGYPSIQGFTTDISVNRGSTIHFKVDTTAAGFRIDVYRLGYYGGSGARKIITITSTMARDQAACLTDTATGLIDCGNWVESASWAVPFAAVSGIYLANLVRADNGFKSQVPFIVRDDASQSEVVFQTSDTTWEAYNSYGGNSLYVGQPDGRAYKVSYNRPFKTRGCCEQQSYLFNAEYPMVRWLEANGYDVSYISGVDTDRAGSLLENHAVFLSVGHDEYWSGTQRFNVAAARNAGVNLAFFSGNEMFWKTRWEPSIDGSGTSHRTLVSYKETHANAKIDPSPQWTGTWRDPRFSPPADGGRPENRLTGTIFTVNGTRNDSIVVPSDDGTMRFWRNTSIANLAAGTSATLPAGTLGYEWDEDLDNGFRRAGLVRLSSATVNGVPLLQDYGSTYAPGTATHHMTLYRAGSGALVFAAGTVQWSWGLDSNHDGGTNPADVRMQQATVNLFADMGVQPATLQPGLVGATPSMDTTAPTSTIESPTPGATLVAPVMISGTASDAGGLVGAVEVSVDDGATWHPATGRAAWTYALPTCATGPATIKVRAADDSANLETPGPGTTITCDNAPVADAGPDRQVNSNVSFSLDASGSTDPNGDPLTFHWAQIGGPPAVIRDEDSAEATVEGVDGPTTLTFEVTVTDDNGERDTDEVVITVSSK